MIGVNKKALIEALKKNMGDISKACKAVGISRTTFYKYKKEDDGFRKELEILDEMDLDFAISKLKECIEDKNITSIMYFLNNKGKSRGFSRDQKNSEERTPITINIKGIADGAI